MASRPRRIDRQVPPSYNYVRNENDYVLTSSGRYGRLWSDQTLNQVISQLDEILFNDFIRRKSIVLREIIRRGILGPDVDWYRAPKPTGALRTFLFQPSLLMLSSTGN
jgi:hypothetical protein